MTNHPEIEPPPVPGNDNTRDLRGRTVKGVLWTFAEMFGRYGVTYVVTIYLARLLSPADYGLVGLATAFFAIAAAIIDGGFKTALVRKKDVTPADYNTVFYTNLALAFLMYAVIFAVAPHIAKFYGEPLLSPLTRLLGLTLIINAMTIVQNAVLQRDMRFGLLTLITAPAAVMSGTAAIFLAYNGFGVISLAVQMLLTSFIGMILYRRLVGWHPALEFSARSFREFFGVGARFSVASITREIGNNMCVMFIGKIFGAHRLGYYSFSNKLINLTANNLTSAVSQVSLASFSKIQDDTDRLLRGYKLALQGTATVIFPLMALIAVMADPLVRLFLSEKWLPAVPYIRILCIQGALAPVYAIGANIIMIKNAGLYLKIECAAVLTLIAMLFSLVPIGIEAFLTGQALQTAIFIGVINLCNRRYFNCTLPQTVGLLAPVAVAAAGMGAAVYAGMTLFETHGSAINLPQCAALLTGAFIVYCIGLWIFKVDEFMNIVRRIIK